MIREATLTDAAAVASIFNQYLARATMVMQPRNAVDYLPLIGGERATIFVAEVAGKVVGFAGVKPYSDRGGYVLAGEVSVFLDAKATGQGFGQALYEQVIPAADALGYRHLTAKIWADNAASIRLHEQQGFRMVGRQEGIGWINGKRVDTVLMERSW
ncbi:MAG: N-acetyltransferase family protein [Bacteroidota bacterium]